MSWLRHLDHAYKDSAHRIRTRRIVLQESPNCEINLDSLDAEALVFNFEGLVDRLTKDSGGRPPRRCDLVAVSGSETDCQILMIEVKGSGTTRPRRIRDAANQLRNSKRIIEGALENCEIQVPSGPQWNASVVVPNPSQSQAARNEVSKTNAEFRRATGMPLRLVLCGDDVVGHQVDSD